jgi:hypothetical protein
VEKEMDFVALYEAAKGPDGAGVRLHVSLWDCPASSAKLSNLEISNEIYIHAGIIIE